MLQSIRSENTDLARGTAGGGGAAADAAATSSPLIDVLWRRRWVLVVTTAACLAFAAIYLLIATPVYVATARVQVEENAPRVLNESRDPALRSENYLQTQVNVFQSIQVLARALEKVQYAELKTFAHVTGDPVDWLRSSGAMSVEVARKADVIAVTMESAHPDEAAAIVNSIVETYIVEQALQRRSTGTEMVGVLQREREDLHQKRDAILQQMLTSTRRNGVVSFQADRGNTVVDRITSLARSLTEAELAAIELRTQRESIEAMMASPASLSGHVQAQQSKGNDSGDREYNELRSQLVQYSLALSNAMALQGENNKRVQALQVTVDSLKQLVAAKEVSIANGHLAVVTAQLAAAEQKERQIRAALKAQQDLAMDQSPEATEHRNLEATADRIQRQLDLLDSRIAEIRVNNVEVGPLSVQVIEPARAAARPIKPKKTMTLIAALLAGWVIGIGIALLREWQDARLRTPEEIRAVLGTPVIAMIPRINPQFSPVTRGQLVRLDMRSPAAEAYRGVRTLLQLGSSSGAKTILMASPASGDGKSTTASNLAIALAQAGDRTLIVDCDLRQPVQHMIFEISGEVGVSSVLAGEAKLRDAISPTEIPGLYVLPCGPVPENPSELLTGKKFARLMQSLTKSFDRIIIDSPPLMNVTDARILAASADATIVVLRMNRSMRRLGVLALDGLDKVGANVLGAIANDVPSDRDSRQYYGSVLQYERDTKRMLTLAQAGGGDPNRRMSPNVTPPNFAVQALTINEPDWSRDSQQQ
ncbi:MAG TPA: polysaccharide biosynthesis tyrosine autokinase [Tepidisphaeraceae bacterium]|jgi:capsular exopolysaccharide synthesis family protein|nr:polysaccharide biosynthesis tyrosine autokinase [Tepidisphaeraceae bacterium]